MLSVRDVNCYYYYRQEILRRWGKGRESLRHGIYGTCRWVVHKHFSFIFTAITFMATQWSMELKAHSHSKCLRSQAFWDNTGGGLLDRPHKVGSQRSEVESWTMVNQECDPGRIMGPCLLKGRVPLNNP